MPGTRPETHEDDTRRRGGRPGRPASWAELSRPAAPDRTPLWPARSKGRRDVARYQFSRSWQEFAQLRVFAFQPTLAINSVIPFRCVTAFTVLEL
jgi:hypothetical protein